MAMQYKITNIAEELGLYDGGAVAATPGSAGIDLYVASLRPIRIDPVLPTYISTGLHLWLGDSSIAALLMPRSSSQIRFTNAVGLIDSDYQGEILIKAVSNGDDPVILQPKQKIAQIVLVHVVSPFSVNFELVDEFHDRTTRGEGGYGSTG